MSHDHHHVFDDELVSIPPDPEDLVADLVGPRRVIESDCPQMFDRGHRWSPRTCGRAWAHEGNSRASDMSERSGATSDGVRAGVRIHEDPHSDPAAPSMDRKSVNVAAFLPGWYVISPSHPHFDPTSINR